MEGWSKKGRGSSKKETKMTFDRQSSGAHLSTTEGGSHFLRPRRVSFVVSLGRHSFGTPRGRMGLCPSYSSVVLSCGHARIIVTNSSGRGLDARIIVHEFVRGGLDARIFVYEFAGVDLMHEYMCMNSSGVDLTSMARIGRINSLARVRTSIRPSVLIHKLCTNTIRPSVLVHKLMHEVSSLIRPPPQIMHDLTTNMDE